MGPRRAGHGGQSAPALRAWPHPSHCRARPSPAATGCKHPEHFQAALGARALSPSWPCRGRCSCAGGGGHGQADPPLLLQVSSCCTWTPSTAGRWTWTCSLPVSTGAVPVGLQRPAPGHGSSIGTGRIPAFLQLSAVARQRGSFKRGSGQEWGDHWVSGGRWGPAALASEARSPARSSRCKLSRPGAVSGPGAEPVPLAGCIPPLGGAQAGRPVAPADPGGRPSRRARAAHRVRWRSRPWPGARCDEGWRPQRPRPPGRRPRGSGRARTALARNARPARHVSAVKGPSSCSLGRAHKGAE